MRPSGSALRLILATSFAFAGTASAEVVEEVYKVPVAVTDAFDGPVSHDVVVTVLRETACAHAPILIIGHGRGPDRLTMGRARFPLAARNPPGHFLAG